MCLRDVIKKHFWRITAIFFFITTIGVGIGWILEGKNCNNNTGSMIKYEILEDDMAAISPKIVKKYSEYWE